MTVWSNFPSNEITRQPLLLIAACVGVICSSIVLPFYTMGLFVVPVTQEFGWSRSEFQLSLLFSTGMGVLTSPLIGLLIHRHGARMVALFGLAGLSLAFLLPAFATGQLWQFYAAYAAMALLGAGTIPVTWTTAVTTNFHRQRQITRAAPFLGGSLALAMPKCEARAAYFLITGFVFMHVWLAQRYSTVGTSGTDMDTDTSGQPAGGGQGRRTVL